MRRAALGIDLRGPEVSWVQLAMRLGRVRVLGSGTLAAGHVPERPPWRRPGRVIVGLPRRTVVLRWLERPDVDDGHLAGLLAYEADAHFPFPADEVVYAFQKLGRQGSRAAVLLAGARKDEVARALERVGALGVEPAAVDVTALAACNALLFDTRVRRGEIACLVDIAGAEAEVSAVRDGVPVSSRALALGEDAAATLADELRRVLSASPAHRPRVFTCGAGADLDARIAAALGLRTEALSREAAGSSLAAFGLALEGLAKVPLRTDLMPAERREKRRARAPKVTVALLALIALLGTMLGLGAVHRQRRALSEITAQLAAARTQVTEVERLAAEVRRLEARLEFIERAARERELPLRVLSELASLLPADAALSDLVSDWPRVQLRGSTVSSPSGLIASFERSALFENATFTSPIAPQGDRQGFQIRVSLRPR